MSMKSCFRHPLLPSIIWHHATHLRISQTSQPYKQSGTSHSSEPCEPGEHYNPGARCEEDHRPRQNGRLGLSTLGTNHPQRTPCTSLTTPRASPTNPASEPGEPCEPRDPESKPVEPFKPGEPCKEDQRPRQNGRLGIATLGTSYLQRTP